MAIPRRRASISLAVLAALCLPLGLAACGGDDSDPDSLTIYSGRNPGLIGPLIDRYEKQQGINIKVRFGETAELASTILEEGSNSPADMFFAQDAGALGAIHDEGLFAPLPADILNRVPSRFRSKFGDWVGHSARSRIIAFNKKELQASDLPRSIFSLSDGKWKGRVGWSPANASFQAFVTAMRKLRGEDAAKQWLEDMKDNDTVSFENNVLVRDAIARGEIDVGLINHYYVAEAVAAEGPDYPVGIFIPPNGDLGALVNTTGVGLLKSSDKRPAVEKFIRFLLGPAGQRDVAERLKEYPLSAGVEPDRSLPPLDSIEQPDIDLSQIDDLQGTLKLLRDTGVL